MDLELGNSASIRRAAPARPAVQLIKYVVLAAAVLLALLAAFLLTRRLAGGLVRPLNAGPLLLTAVLLATTAALLRQVWLNLPRTESDIAANWLVWVLPALALVGFAAALSLPQTSLWPLRAFWAVLAVEEAVSLWLVWRSLGEVLRPEERDEEDAVDLEPTSVQPEPSIPISAQEPFPSAHAVLGDRELRLDPPQQPSPHILPPNTSQQLTRAVSEDGSELLYGLLRGHFAPGQRALRLHVSFCPPFETIPEVSVETLEGPELTVRPGQILPYGLRLDLRLKTLSADAVDVVLELFVRGPKPKD